MRIPADAPDWLEPALNAMQERATDLVCNGPSSERGAGYLKAVEDFKAEIENQFDIQNEKRKIALAGVKVRG